MSQQPEAVGRYRIVQEIGRGAMGAVYKAVDPQLDRQVAIKMISVAMAGGSDNVDEISARFEREARVAARLHHPNVVAVYDVGKQDDKLYLVMEFVEGETLAQRLSRGEFPSVELALDIVSQSADALAVAHAAGVVHRDIKPGNILISREGKVKVSDFGVAKAVGEGTELTRTGMMVGSPAYMAPEQVKGMLLDGRSDLFSLGVVLFEMLLHRKPFPADTVTTLVYQILNEDPLSDITLSGVLNREVQELLRWSLAKDRESRVPDAQTLAVKARAILARIRGGEPAETAPTRQMNRAASTAPTALAVTPPLPGAPEPAKTPSAPEKKGGGLGLIAGLGGGLVAIGLVAFLILHKPAVPPSTDEQQTPGATSSSTATPANGSPGVPTTSIPPTTTVPPTGEANPAVAEPGARATQPATTAPKAPKKPATQPTAVATTPTSPVVEPVEPPAPKIHIAETFICREAAEFHVDPEDTMIEIDGTPIGKADDWDGMGGGKAYKFPGPGEYTVKLSLAKFKTAWIKIVVTPSSRTKTVNVDTELEEDKDN
ncbi:MAG: protein kinase [Thermoanaerobaculia bacterium]